MTAIRDRKNDLDDDASPVTWDERAIVGPVRGLPWWGAIALGFGLAVVGATIDLQVLGKLGLLFKACYFLGAIGAVCAVRRKNLFGPMVQPPLVLAVTVPGVVLVSSGSAGDALSRMLDVATPLINGFPTMAFTTGITVAIGVFRIFRERDPEAAGQRSASREAKASEPKPDLPVAAAGKPAAAEGKVAGRRTAAASKTGGAAVDALVVPRRGRRTPPPAVPETPARGNIGRDRARPLDQLDPGAPPPPPVRRRPLRDPGGAAAPKRDAEPGAKPGRRRRAEDPAVARPTEVPRRPLRDGTPPPPPPRRARPEPGDAPPRRGPVRKPPAGGRPWEIEDRD